MGCNWGLGSPWVYQLEDAFEEDAILLARSLLQNSKYLMQLRPSYLRTWQIRWLISSAPLTQNHPKPFEISTSAFKRQKASTPRPISPTLPPSQKPSGQSMRLLQCARKPSLKDSQELNQKHLFNCLSQKHAKYPVRTVQKKHIPPFLRQVSRSPHLSLFASSRSTVTSFGKDLSSRSKQSRAFDQRTLALQRSLSAIR